MQGSLAPVVQLLRQQIKADIREEQASTCLDWEIVSWVRLPREGRWDRTDLGALHSLTHSSFIH